MLDTISLIFPGLEIVYLLLLVLIVFSIIGMVKLSGINRRLQSLVIVELDIKQILIAIRNKLKWMAVSDKVDLGSFVPEFFNFDQIKVRAKLLGYTLL